MLSYVIRRTILLGFVMLGITAITFVLMNVLPGDSAEIVAIYRYGVDNLLSQELEVLKKEIGADQPLFLSYFHWLIGLFQLDLGTSMITKQPVVTELSYRIPATLKLGLATFLMIVFTSLPLGILCAKYKDSWLDRFIMTIALVAASLPNFAIGLGLIILFSVTFNFLPIFGTGSFRHYILPTITLGVTIAFITAQVIRTNILETMEEDYILMARTKGISEHLVFWVHALRNALVPVITILGLKLNHIIGGTVIVETIFGWPGVGQLLVQSVAARDLPVIQGIVLFMGFSFVLVNFLVDLAYALIDPRIRYGKDEVYGE